MMFDKYLFRCSSLGKLSPSKPELSQTTKTYLTELFTQEVRGVRKEISSKFFEKGNLNEDDGITLLNYAIYPVNVIMKNTERKQNTFINGEMDCMAPDKILYDIKNAWDWITFDKAKLSFDYEWQLRGYMWLWNVDKSRLFYCLTNMPESLLIDEERKLFYANHFISYEDYEYQKLCEELRKKHNYDNFQFWERFKIWDVRHSVDKINKLKDKITVCRAFLNKLHHEEMDRINSNKSLMNSIDVEVRDNHFR